MPDPNFLSPLTNPFGLSNVEFSATPTLADIDNDGDLDAFVGNFDGNTLYYQNTGTSSSPSFAAPLPNPFGLSDVGDYASPTLADIDNDGDLDAFVGNSGGNTLYYQNTGTSSSPSFAAPISNPFGLTDVGLYASPTLTDIDNDGDLDAFVGDINGNINYYQNTGTSLSPSFAAPISNPFGLTNVGSSASPTFADIDNDGDLDAFVANFGGDTLYFENTGTSNSPSFAAPISNPFGLTNVGSSAFPTFADIDNDGDFDAFVGNGSGDTLYFENAPVVVNQPPVANDDSATTNEDTPITGNVLANDTDPDSNPLSVTEVNGVAANVGTPITLASGALLTLNSDGSYSYDPNAQFESLNNGDTATDSFTYTVSDGTATDTATVNITLNGVTDTPEIFLSPVTNSFGLSDVGSFAAPTFADLDGDGDLDAFVGNQDGDILYYQNTGSASSPSFATAVTDPFGLSDVGSFAAPTFADLDLDGDLDAFVGNGDGNTLYYQNTGSASSPSFATAVTDPFGLSDVGVSASPTFADLDLDGDLDAFVGNAPSNILYYQNTGSASSPSFATAVTNPFGLSNGGLAAAPTFADLDLDGDLDAFVGNSKGDILYSQNTGSASSPSFATAVTNPFGLSNVGYFAAPTFADLDLDGDLDAFVGNKDGNILYFENDPVVVNQPPVALDDSATTNEDTPITGNVLSNDTDPDSNPLSVTEVNGVAANVGTQITLTSGALLTLNADGSYSYDPNAQFESLNEGDTATDSFTYTVSDGTATDTATVTLTINGVTDTPQIFLSPVTNPFGLTNVGFSAAPTFADIDGDGDLDAFVGQDEGNTLYYENTGTATSPSFAAPVTNPFGLTDVGSWAAPTLVDIDGDGDLDAFVGQDGGNTLYYENTGTATSPSFAAPVTNPFGLTTVGTSASPTFADIDNDGDLDAFVGNANGDTLYYQNTGTASSPSFAAPLTNPFGLTNVGNFAAPTFADIDNDGDLDAFVGNFGGNTLYYQNTGTASSPSFAALITNPFGLSDVGYFASPTFADIDSDGDLDAFVGNQQGDTRFYRNTTILIVDTLVDENDGDLSAGDVSLREAIASVATGGTVNFDPTLAGGTITLALGELLINKGLTINGLGANQITVNGNNASGVFNIDDTDNSNQSQVVIAGLTITGGNGTSGNNSTGGIANTENLTVNSSVITNNTGSGGGGITNFATLSVNNSTISGNTSTQFLGGGGILNGGTLTVSNSTISGNTAASYGGGISSPFGTVIVSNSTLSGNTAQFGGAIANGETLTVENSTITANTANDSGGGIVNFATANVTSTIIAANTDNKDISGSFTSGGNNLIGNGDTGTGFTNGVNSDIVGTAATPVDPLLGPLQDNGGPTQTQALLPGSPAINAGSNPNGLTTDQRGTGFDRTVAGATDIGAYEEQNIPPDAVDDTVSTDENTLLSGNVLTNDTDGNNDPLTVTAVNGNAGNVGTQITLASGALLTLNANGSFSYNPNGQFESLGVGETASDSFTYTISDGSSSDTATVNITINGVNDAPVAVNDSATTNEDTAVNIAVLANDTDIEGDTLSIFNFTNGSNGTVTLNNNGTPGNTTDDLLVYTPNANFNGTDSFTYTIADGNGGTSTATVNVTINPVNDPPVAVNDSATTNEDTPVNISVLTNDTDVDGDPLSISNFTSGSKGTVTLNNNGTPGNTTDDFLVYTPNANVNGTDSFTYTISDGNGGTSTATVNVTINPVNDPPVAVNDSATTNEDTAVNISVLTNDTDVDGDPLSISNFTSGSKGTVTLNNNGTSTNTTDDFLVYTPNANVNGTDSFTYTIADGNGGTSTATVNVTINPVNDAPVAVDDNASTSYMTPVTISVNTLLANDIDIDSTTLSIINVNNAVNGTATLNNNSTPTNTSDDFVVFNPGLLIGILGGTGSFDYILSDGSLTSTATVTVAVGGLIFGSNQSDSLFGTNGDDSINGGNGNDTIYGALGNDTIDGGNGNDVLYGDGQMNGGGGNDIITGGNGNDSLYGGSGSDTLIGENGSDFLDGGLNNDTLTGGSNQDTFVLATGNGTDTITDFQDGSDLIGLSGGLTYSSLSFSGNNILFGSEVLATLTGVNTNTLTTQDFVVV